MGVHALPAPALTESGMETKLVLRFVSEQPVIIYANEGTIVTVPMFLRH